MISIWKRHQMAQFCLSLSPTRVGTFRSPWRTRRRTSPSSETSPSPYWWVIDSGNNYKVFMMFPGWLGVWKWKRKDCNSYKVSSEWSLWFVLYLCFNGCCRYALNWYVNCQSTAWIWKTWVLGTSLYISNYESCICYIHVTIYQITYM